MGLPIIITVGKHRLDGPANSKRFGMYSKDRNARLRSEESLLLKDSRISNISNIFLLYGFHSI